MQEDSTPWRSSSPPPSTRGTLSAAFAAQPYHDVAAGDLVAFRRDRRLFDDHSGVRNVEQRVFALDKEMMMLRVVGVEISLRAIDGDLAQQPDIGELMQGVVHGRERDRHLRLGSFLVEHLRRDVPITL